MLKYAKLLIKTNLTNEFSTYTCGKLFAFLLLPPYIKNIQEILKKVLTNNNI